ncbi:unnamed protein product [Leuciscus chuanchicus]
MRELVILAALVSALHAASLHKDSDVGYKCQADQDKNATLAAERFINEHHRHGYKFKFVSLDSRSAEKKIDPCEVVLRITLEETECHITSPKPLDQCTTRSEAETKVTAKCNVTVSSFKGKASVESYICDTEAASHKILVTKCPDCPSLLPLHDPKGLESVQSALKKFNKDSSHASYFKLLEVGRIRTQWMSFGQSFFAEFAIMETNCSKEEASQKPEACKALCGDKARYGFCESSKFGTPVQGVEGLEVECKVYEAQVYISITHLNWNSKSSQRETVNSMDPTAIQDINQGMITPIARDMEAMITKRKHLTKGAVQNMLAMTTKRKHLAKGAVQNMQGMTTKRKHLTKGAVLNMQGMTTKRKHLAKGAVQNMLAMTTKTKHLAKGAVQNIHTTVQKALQGFQNQHLRDTMNSHAMAL